MLFCGCSSHFTARESATQNALEEVRIALVDLKQSMQAQKMDLTLLEEKVASKNRSPDFSLRLKQIEKMQETISSDLRSLHAHANKTSFYLN